MLGIQRKTALATGAAGGIGRAIAWTLAETGADIAAHDRDIPARLSSLVTKIERLGRRAVALSGDVRDQTAVGAFVAQELECSGGSTFSSTTPAS
jgi:3-oxoacyl-[acyl-carrier protein] reductase